MREDILETDRLLIRPWREDDAEDLYRYASDERVSEMALWPRHTSVDMSRLVIREFFIPNPDTLAVVLKATDEVIGCIGLVPEGDEHYAIGDSEREAGYWIGYPHWGRGLTTEAMKALIEYCRSKLKLRSLLITADRRNIASHRVAEKCGFSHVADYVFDEIPSKAYRLELEPVR